MEFRVGSSNVRAIRVLQTRRRRESRYINVTREILNLSLSLSLRESTCSQLQTYIIPSPRGWHEKSSGVLQRKLYTDFVKSIQK